MCANNRVRANKRYVHCAVFRPSFQKGRTSIFKKGIFSAVFDDQKGTQQLSLLSFINILMITFVMVTCLTSSLFICLTIGYKLMSNCFYFWGKKYFFCLVAEKGQGANFKI